MISWGRDVTEWEFQQINALEYILLGMSIDPTSTPFRILPQLILTK